MPLDFQLVQAPFAYGLAEGVDPHMAPFGTLMTAENACWDRTGRVRKRRGLTFLSSVPSGLVRLFVRGAELSGITSSGVVQSWSPTASAWAPHVAPASMLTVKRSTVIDNVTSMRSGDLAILADGSRVYTWVEGGTTAGFNLAGGIVYARKVDKDGNEVQPATMLYDGSASATSIISRVVGIGSDYYVFFVASGNLWVFINGNATSYILQTNVWNSLTFGPFDVVAVGSNLLVTYHDGANLRTQYYAPNGLNAPVQGTSVSTATSSSPGLSMDAVAGDYVYISFATITNTTNFTILNITTLATVVAPQAVDPTNSLVPVIARVGPGQALMAWSSPIGNIAGRRTGETRYCMVGISGAQQGAQRHASGVFPVTKPFAVGSKHYLIVTTAGTTTNRTSGDTFILDVTSAIPGTATPPPYEAAHPEVLTSGATGGSKVVPYNGVWYALAPFASSFGAFQAAREGRRLYAITSVSKTDGSLRSVPYGPETYFSGAVVPSYDGSNLVPAGGALPPYFAPSPYSGAVAGAGLANGSYVLNTYSERRNAAGILHRGPTGIPLLATTTTGNNLVTLTITPSWVGASTDATGRYGRDILLPIYLSAIGQSIPLRWTQDGYQGMLFDTYVTGTDLTQNVATPVTATAPAIYTASGELDDYQAPSSLYMTVHQNRLWSVGPDGYTIWFSKDSTVNPGVAPGFHPSLTITFNETIVAMASMDSGLLAFTASGLFIIQGDGPAPNGQGATYQAIKVQTDVGCTNQRSVVSTPEGVMFQSARGIYMVSRGLEVVFLGKTVQDRTDGVLVTSAVLVANRGEVRFALDSGVSVVYNYIEKQWSTARYTSNGAYGRTIVDACMWNGSYTVLFEDGNVASEAEFSYLDGTEWVPMTLETSWNNAAGPLAYQSVRNFSIEGFSRSDHQLTVSVGFDNELDYAQTFTWLDGTPVTAIGPLESLEVSIGVRRKCQAIRFKVQDASPATLPRDTGQGPVFDAVGVQVGVKSGFRPKSVGRSA